MSVIIKTTLMNALSYCAVSTNRLVTTNLKAKLAELSTTTESVHIRDEFDCVYDYAFVKRYLDIDSISIEIDHQLTINTTIESLATLIHYVRDGDFNYIDLNIIPGNFLLEVTFEEEVDLDILNNGVPSIYDLPELKQEEAQGTSHAPEETTEIVKQCEGIDDSNFSGPDEDGYYTVKLGTYNKTMQDGCFWDIEGLKASINDNESSINDSLRKMGIPCELGIPKREEHPDPSAYVERLGTIDKRNICCMIKNLTTVENGEYEDKDLFDKPITDIYAKIIPYGPHKQVLKDMLVTHNAPSFGMRAFCKKSCTGGGVMSDITNVITWDAISDKA